MCENPPFSHFTIPNFFLKANRKYSILSGSLALVLPDYQVYL